jgi:dihydrodipicolinate synthase/N-acetylneuraminate lyase
VEANPIPVKAALALRGAMADTMRLPLTPATAQTRALLSEALERLAI